MVRLKNRPTRAVVQQFKGVLDLYTDRLGRHIARKWPVTPLDHLSPGTVQAQDCFGLANALFASDGLDYAAQIRKATFSTGWTARDYFYKAYFGTLPYAEALNPHPRPAAQNCRDGLGAYWSLTHIEQWHLRGYFENMVYASFTVPYQPNLFLSKTPPASVPMHKLRRAIRYECGRDLSPTSPLTPFTALAPFPPPIGELYPYGLPIGDPAPVAGWGTECWGFFFLSQRVPPVTGAWSPSVSPWFLFRADTRHWLSPTARVWGPWFVALTSPGNILDDMLIWPELV
jgi:hypothetical protein